MAKLLRGTPRARTKRAPKPDREHSPEHIAELARTLAKQHIQSLAERSTSAEHFTQLCAEFDAIASAHFKSLALTGGFAVIDRERITKLWPKPKPERPRKRKPREA